MTGIRAAICVLLIACMQGEPARAAPRESVFTGGESIIGNGGFEQGGQGWQLDARQQIATGKNVAHSGEKCIVGETTGPSQAGKLIRTIPARQGRVYRFEFWARGTKGVKLAAFLVQPGQKEKERQRTATFPAVTAKWKRFDGEFVAESTGKATLQIIAPSSFAGNPGKMWVDDVAVFEYELSAPTCVTNDEGFNDQPTMARADDGSLYLAWISFRDGDDSLQVARYGVDGENFNRLAEWEVLGGEKTYIYGPRMVAAGDRAFLLYAAEVKGNWDIYAAECGPDGPSKPVRVTSSPGVDTEPAGAWSDGVLWAAWESNSDQSPSIRRIFAASIADGKASKPEPLSAEGVSAYDPSMTALADGQVCAAWHSFAENNFDVHLRRRASTGEWAAPQRLTRGPWIDRHAELFARGAELWIAYETGEMANYSLGGVRDKRVLVARIGSDGLETPLNGGKPSPLSKSAEAAAPAFDASGRLWVAAARPGDRSWSVVLGGHDGRSWGPASPLTSLTSLDRRPSLAIDGDRAIVAFQADDMDGVKYQTREESFAAKSNVYLVSRDLSETPAAGAMAFEPLVEIDEPFEPGALRVAYDEDAPTPSIDYEGETLNLYYGDLHDHTEVSICGRTHDESIDEAYQDMRDIAGLDFACVTDHGYNLTPYLWGHTAKMARINNDPGRFLTFLGEEWTSTFKEFDEKRPYGFYGHRNLVFADAYFPRWWNAGDHTTPDKIWEELREMKANFVQIPHQLADTGNVPVDWDYADETAQPVAEIFQGRGSYEYLGAPRMARRATPTKGAFIQDAWARGLVIGVIASPDHGGGRGKACVYAPDLSREAILDALRARHCYGTTAARIFLDVRVNGALMGEKIAAPEGKPVEVRIRVRGPGDIESVEVCRNNQYIYTDSPEGREADLTFIDEDPLEGASYYYVRVTQKDAEMAWSSPVWLGIP
jgi:hypothetical protein